MLFLRVVLHFIFLFLPIVIPIQINLHLTKWINENDDILQHDCLHVAVSNEFKNDPSQMILYCMSEWPSKWNIQTNNFDKNFTFADLSILNVTSQQLYMWSAPMDIVEDYQFYLDQLQNSNETSLSMQVYYNCTLPRFGPMCQYSLDMHQPNHESLNEILADYYNSDSYDQFLPTCYTYLQCNPDISSLCFDWSDICNNIIQCINGIDEEHCSQLEVNECKDDEYRCINGQCVPAIFYNDDIYAPDCLDRSDEYISTTDEFLKILMEPKFANDDLLCWESDWSNILRYTTSCLIRDYVKYWHELMFSSTPNSMTDICWSTLKCYLRIPNAFDLECFDICQNDECRDIIEENCPDMFFMPPTPVLYGHIYLAYTKKYIVEQKIWTNEPEYICYDPQLCGGFDTTGIPLPFNNTICYHPKDFSLSSGSLIQDLITNAYYISVHVELYKCNTIFRNDSTFCNKSTMYKCINSSKCISNYRLLDGINDCDYGDDEQRTTFNDLSFTSKLQTHFYCAESKKYISRKLIGDDLCQCYVEFYQMCEDELLFIKHVREHISFPSICNGIIDLKPLNVSGRNETDETECEQWSCNNSYTRCNGLWNCFDGADEVDCYPTSLINCPPQNHVCFSPETMELMCLAKDKGNNGYIDCFGATDEPQLCREHIYSIEEIGFYCVSNAEEPCTSRHGICNEGEHCNEKSNETFCNHIGSFDFSRIDDICNEKNTPNLSDMEQLLCNLFISQVVPKITHFSLNEKTKSTNSVTKDNVNTVSITRMDLDSSVHCHRGLDLRVWSDIDENLTNLTCLCPPSYYGDACQYQNQRVSLTIKFQAFYDSWRIPFIIIVSLIDNSDQRIIHSYEQITYIPMKNCQTKFNMYLLYSTRPKNQSEQYSIHVDVYEKLSLAYRGSLLVPIPFNFLPIQRIAVLLSIPYITDSHKGCSNKKCIHGECIQYFNDPNNTTFCQCNEGWHGKDCSIPHICQCSANSLCIGFSSNNRSICICPINRWGSRCLLHDDICQQENITCQNGGKCIPMASTKNFECICPKEFFGEKCEIPSNKISLSFDKDLVLPETMLIHFIEVKQNNAPPEIGVTFKKISINRKPVIIFWPRIFHIVFVELFPKNYYLTYLENKYNQSTIIEKQLKSSDRCPYIGEIFNETFTKLHLIRRIKYFHVPCRNLQLSCFYDDAYLCLCMNFGNQRMANCIEFNHTLKHDCSQKNICKNGGQCLQDSTNCPQTVMCVCPTCFYGSQCQFSTNGYGLSLDAILGNHIQQYVNIKDQTIIVQISLILTVLMTFTGLMDGICSLITFKHKDIRKTGCGIYLLSSSITTLFTMILFFIKFHILLISQMIFLTNHSFLQFQCVTIDYLLRIALNMDQWLNACVAYERTIIVIKEHNFDKKKIQIL
ncbi:unnamed protein product [Adineta steineri]|uniref:EGF-like domain-containing protein n=1 Tax=Adineta steineri TaxID=433720 RepID=A0A818NLY7_9BILA|nr:unnamed protein product [Adineta steineri]